MKIVKIADFGLSEYYRPGGTLNSQRGTLSFQAPEIFSESNYAGPPLDVWALGVILFALLSGRLPFEGPELNSQKRPRDQIIKQKIMSGQFKVDDHLSSDAKDVLRRMLRMDPVQVRRVSLSSPLSSLLSRALSSPLSKDGPRAGAVG